MSSPTKVDFENRAGWVLVGGSVSLVGDPAPDVVSALAGGVRKVTEALRRLALRYVPVASDKAFRNLNTPEDLERYGRR